MKVVGTEAKGRTAVETSGQRLTDPSRLDESVKSLRGHTARGTLINSGFQLGLTGVGAIQRIAVAAFLTRAEYGLWGLLVGTLLTLSFITQVGIGDKYVQQSEPDQERAFQKAFTINLGLCTGCFLLAAAVLPLYGLLYNAPQMVVPGIVLAVGLPVTALQSTVWIPYRRMQYARTRTLTAIDPVMTTIFTIALVATGAGYWGLIIGGLAGSSVAAVVCLLSSPYRIRLRYERGTAREYVNFSLPLFGNSLMALAFVQGGLLVANRTVGLAGVGAIGLAATVAQFSQTVDAIVSQTIYPAVCAVVDRTALLAEVFVKSNRLALMWAMPAGVGVALFVGDFVHFVLGDRWRPAVGVLAVIGVSCAIQQVAFNWAVFLRALNVTRPIFFASVAQLVVFLAVTVPTMIAFGLPGYGYGFAAMTVSQMAIRGWYMRRVFPGFSVVRQLLHAVVPVAPATALVLVLRVVTPGPSSGPEALFELLIYSFGVVGCTYLFDRALLAEVVGYVRRGGRGSPLPASPTAE